MNDSKLQQLARAVIETEARAVSELVGRIGSDFIRACHYMYECKGRIVVLGMGKSGHIGDKIAATLASTGSPSFFVHPGEASHGDMGMITRDDTVLALSNSGETSEIITILPLITGYFAFHRVGMTAPSLIAIHILSVELLMVVFPFTKLTHAFTVFLSRWYNGAISGYRGVES